MDLLLADGAGAYSSKTSGESWQKTQTMWAKGKNRTVWSLLTIAYTGPVG